MLADGDFKAWVETGITDHVVRVMGHPNDDRFWDYVEVAAYEGNCKHGKYDSWKYRLRSAWRALCGEPPTFASFWGVENVDAFIAAMQQARATAYPKEQATC